MLLSNHLDAISLLMDWTDCKLNVIISNIANRPQQRRKACKYFYFDHGLIITFIISSSNVINYLNEMSVHEPYEKIL